LWDKSVVDRTAQLTSWVDFCYAIKKRGVTIFAYANNHYTGYAPATVEQFLSMWEKVEPTAKPRTPPPDKTLFG